MSGRQAGREGGEFGSEVPLRNRGGAGSAGEKEVR